MNEKPVRKPRNVWINPGALHKARVEALRQKRALGEWLEEAIDEKIEGNKRRLNRKDLLAQVFLGSENS